MLTALNVLQLLLYVGLLGLAGQGLLYVLAGPRRDSNVFYQLMRIVGRPFTALVRALTPAQVSDRQVGVLSFALVALAYLAVTMEKIGLCLAVGVEACR